VDPERVAAIVAGVAEGCRRARCVLLGGETAEHPGVMADDQFDL
ncbi:MAG TPA: phosphoribosylformylglycinamidine cyclo-ligase, partial [Actinobacteria bacterium]|nr:phosphoribosylformylglycinamidine cyclo-ligase [Actinomycetota bacterium]